MSVENKNIERKTLFLYPEEKKQKNHSFKKITQLITDVKTIINLCNRQIQHLLFDTCFSDVKCVPSVIMRCVSDCCGNDIEYGNVRICVTKYNEEDYTDCYTAIINEFNNGTSNISHLVALHICSSSDVEFSVDNSGKFDVIIRTGLSKLEVILTSIMMDMSLYHYFALSDTLEKRKEFNKVKYEYLYKKYINNGKGNIYGSGFSSEKPVYLPLSLMYISKMKSSNCKDKINELISEYAYFLATSFSHKIILTSNMTVKNPFDYKHIPTFRTLESYISENKSLFCSLPVTVLIGNTSTSFFPPCLVKYRDESMCEPWAESLCSGVNGYDIYTIEEEK